MARKSDDKPPPERQQGTRAPAKTGDWRHVNRVQLAALMGVHPDTITDHARQGMPVVMRGGAGKEGQYDAVDCLAWWRAQFGRNAKDAAQTELYNTNVELGQLRLQKERGDLVSREDVVRAGRNFVKAWASQVRALPRRLRHAGLLASADEEAAVAAHCRHLLEEIAAWKTVDDLPTSDAA